jgi:hypothetical protein
MRDIEPYLSGWPASTWISRGSGWRGRGTGATKAVAVSRVQDAGAEA